MAAEKAPVSVSKKDVGGFKSINSWGVKDRAGEWVFVTDHPWFAPHDAKNITRTAALDVYNRNPNAFQLIDGCDWWACLSDEEEVLVVVKEKTDVPAPETVPRTGASAGGPRPDAPQPPSSTEDAPGDD